MLNHFVILSATPTRYESVGCDNENFSSPKESPKGQISRWDFA